MALFGVQETHLTSVKTHARYCSGCNKNNTIILNIFKKQMYFFGIPLFPVAKSGNAFCQTCKTTLEEEQMSEFIRHEYLLLKNKNKGPSWQLSGSLLLLGVTLTLSLISKTQNQPGLQYFTSPLKGDIYEYKVADGNYSTMKVIKVGRDSLYISLNQHKIENVHKIDWIDKDENYTRNILALERQKINDMYNNGMILEINRDK